MAKPTVDRLTPEGQRFLAEIEKLKTLKVKIGFQQGKEQEDDGTDVCEIALWNEVGTSSTPSRPFMRDAVDNHEEEINKFLDKQFTLLATGKTDAEGMMKAIGVYIKGLVQAEIVDGTFTPNAPSTIKRKKSDKPLIDTGTMRQSVNFVVVDKK